MRLWPLPEERIDADSRRFQCYSRYFPEDPKWFDWSAKALAEWAEKEALVINPIIYAEVSIRFDRIEELENALPSWVFVREDLPWEAAFLAGKCFLLYRKRGGRKTSPLPDFYIGAHAAVRGYFLLTRDAKHYRTYFPKLKIISPDNPRRIPT